MMQWNRSNAIGLAKAACSYCHGEGIRRSPHREVEAPCNCVFRAVFRACYNRFRECSVSSLIGTASLELSRGPQGRQSFGRKREEYMADFCLVSRRVLDDMENRVFRYHFLLGADWRLCTRKLKMDRGTFFHTIYRIQQKLGRAFADLKPYALYPPSEYFHSAVTKNEIGAMEVGPQRQRERSLAFPLPLSA